MFEVVYNLFWVNNMFDKNIIEIDSIFHILHNKSKSLTLNKYPEPLKTYELSYNLFGKGIMNFNHKTIKTYADTIVYRPRGIKNANYMGKVHELPFENIIIFFQTESDMPKDAFSFDGRKTPNLRSLFIKADKLWNSGNPINPNNVVYYRCVSILYQIMAEISALFANQTRKYSKLNNAIEFIEKNFNNQNMNLNIGELAEMCNLSYSHFKRLFITQFGIPPQKYIINMRMEYALMLLQNHQMTISLIAEMCGYENVYYFSNAFKNYFGYPPTKMN